MKRFSLPLLIVLLLGAGAYWLLARHTSAPSGAANQDARALTEAEQAAFLPLVCGGASAGSAGYDHNCASLIGYPSADYGGAGLGLGMTLTSVIYGHISDATSTEAYVSYRGSFEPIVNGDGGGILFNQDGKGGWTLAKWVPGGSMDGCLSLNPQGRAKMLCVLRGGGQGEIDTLLVTEAPGSQSSAKIFRASDLRGMDPNANCALRTSANQDVLLSIDSVSRNGTGYAAQIEYVPAAQADAECKAQNFGAAPMSKGTLALSWDGTTIAVAPGFNFAPPERMP